MTIDYVNGYVLATLTSAKAGTTYTLASQHDEAKEIYSSGDVLRCLQVSRLLRQITEELTAEHDPQALAQLIVNEIEAAIEPDTAQ